MVSNLGRLTIPKQYGALQLAAIYEPCGTTHIDQNLVVGVTTLGDQMSFTIVYLEPDSSFAQVEQLQQTAMQFLS